MTMINLLPSGKLEKAYGSESGVQDIVHRHILSCIESISILFVLDKYCMIVPQVGQYVQIWHFRVGYETSR